ncbi:MAG TPA: GNAT family N-acetyltransferase, partial [Thermomicrobiales bacterium]|nr:GNAT family N-acetyltransferase [Thermomicrobiales bacterium]
MGEVPTIEEAAAVTAGDYRALLAAVGWRAYEASDAALEAALTRTWNLAARAPRDGRLVGLARVLDDGLIYASIWDVIVAPEWQRRGVARALMERVMARLSGRRLVALVATPAGVALYRSLGFAETSNGSRALFIRSPAAPAPNESSVTSSDDRPEKRPVG